MTYFLTGSFLLPFIYLGRTTNHSIPLGYVLQLLVHGYKGTPLCFLDLFSSDLGFWRTTRRLWIKSLHSLRSWWSRSQGVRKCHYGQSRDTFGRLFGGLPELGVYPQLLKDQDFQRFSLWIKGTLLYTQNYRVLVASKDVDLEKMQWQLSICSCLVTRMQDEIKVYIQPAYYLTMW